VSEFKEAIQSLVEAFPDAKSNEARYRFIAQRYADIVSRHVVIDCFYGSCAVFMPPYLTLDIEAVCAYSGYVHSCGHNIFIRNIEKGNTDEFFAVIDKYVEHHVESQKPVWFSVYAHEDFTDYDREKKEYLRHGLDDIKIYVEKFYMGSIRLVSILNEMRSRYAGKLRIPNPGNYADQLKERKADPAVDRSRTIWLLVDRSIGQGIKNRGPHRYFICYEQQFINENPFHLFEENKPAWIGPITIPHTLMSAMINIAEPNRIEGKALLADPFVGTGTTWFETHKYSNVKAICSDNSKIMPLLVRDNLEFFAQSYKLLRPVQKSIEYLAMSDSERHSPGFVDKGISHQDVDRAYDWMVGFLEEIAPTNGIPKDFSSFVISTKQLQRLKSRKPLERMLFYLGLRTLLRHVGAFERGSATWKEIYRKEARILAAQIKRLRDLKRRESKTKDRSKDFTVFEGSYSLSCAINFDILRECHNDRRTRSQIKICDARKLKKRSYDIIITDPPYGFNTDDRLQDLAQLYAEVIKVMIDGLKHEGQLILALPDRSHTGRRSPIFTHKEIVIQQVLSLAEQANREVIIPAYSVPKSSDLFRPPYFWESERALRRSILHFRIRDLVTKSGS
jgi:tRNA G10  N-methylase Trm11